MSEGDTGKGFSNATGKWIYSVRVIDHLRFIQCITDSRHPGDVPLDTVSEVNCPAVHTDS
tara:strand:+ start:479 stop:658 length:180 start_codon:yes stop_codon:yes gene_type:complete